METKNCYIYDKKTREYIGTGIAYESPLENDVFIAPPNSTYIEPPATKQNKVACFHNNAWELVDDFRGEYVLNIVTSEVRVVQNIGTLSENSCLIPSNIYADFEENKLKYKVIDNVLTDISDTDEYKVLLNNVGKHLLNIQDGSITTIEKVMEIPENCQVLDDELYTDYINNSAKYKIIDGVLTDFSNTIEYKEFERQKIAQLHLTAADVERALYKAKQLDFDDIIKMAETIPNIDIKELKIELKANDFYRGNPYIDSIGTLLGISSEKLDRFFQTNNYEYLI